MYAIIEDGSRQYRAEVGETIVIDFREAKLGETLELPNVLLIGSGSDSKIGRPLVTGAKVVTEVVDFPKTKTITQKYRRRKASKRLSGHTQPYVRVKVKEIVTG